MTDTNVERASRLETATLSDALDKLGIAGQCLGIKPLDHRFRLAGRAFTSAYAPVGHPLGTVGDFIDDVPEGHAAEMRIRDAIAGGLRLDEARRQQQYHLLQRPGSVQ
jgi:regulator of RNase E activity RraA